jgi:hypothetical protein
METVPLSFIDEPIEVIFNKPPMLEKKPDCPNAFVWQDQRYVIVRSLSERVELQRRGRMARNMEPAHASRAEVQGSWGVGRFTFYVEVESGRIFEIYYDRAPNSAADRKGHWFIKGERQWVKPD